MPDPKLKEWGVYVYFAADVPSPAMQRAARSNLLKLADAGSNERVGITALMDLPEQDTQLYVIPPQPQGQHEWVVRPRQFLTNVNTASVDTIREFFEWSVANCPAKLIAFVFYGHGYAIDDFDPRLSSLIPPQDVVPDKVDLGRSGPLSSVAKLSADNFARSRSLPLKLIFDSSHDAVLNNNQVASVIRACRTNLPHGMELAILGFDCCNMAMAEVLCEMEGCAEIAVAAESGLPFRSWISESVLDEFLAAAPLNPDSFAKTAVENFIQSFADNSSFYVALSACRLTLCKDVEIAARALAEALTEAAEDPANRAAIFEARNNDVSYSPDGFIDFGTFCRFLSEDLPETAVAQACVRVQEALRKFVIASEYAPKNPDRRISLSTGLSIWFPPWIENPAVQFRQKQQSIDYFSNGYHRTKFALTSGWDRFLSTMLVATQGNGNTEAAMAQFSQGGTMRQGAGLGSDDHTVGSDDHTVGSDDHTVGSDDHTVGQGSSYTAFNSRSTRGAGVVVRGFVEAYGPLGDTELTVSVKWPAGSIGPAPNGPGYGPKNQPVPSIRPSRLSGPESLIARNNRKLPPGVVPPPAAVSASDGTPAKKAANRAPAKRAAKRATRRVPSA